jgi:signal transduction histidine kinase
VLQNLVQNAIKYTRGKPEAHVAVQARREGGELVISVRDDGVGFKPEYGHKLFGVFQRLHADKEFEGTGIGLATVRRVVQRHGGRTWAESDGSGAAFHFTLPAEEASR